MPSSKTQVKLDYLKDREGIRDSHITYLMVEHTRSQAEVVEALYQASNKGTLDVNNLQNIKF